MNRSYLALDWLISRPSGWHLQNRSDAGPFRSAALLSGPSGP